MDVREQPPAAQSMDVSQIEQRLSSVVRRVSRKEARVLVEESGIAVAPSVSVEDLERLQRLDQDWEQTTEAISRFSQAFADIPVAELDTKIDEIIADIRVNEVAGRRTA